MQSYRWPDWESVTPSQNWEDLGEMTVDESWNDLTSRCVSDDRSWLESDGPRYVNPGILTQRTLQKVIETLYCPSRPGQSSLHARQFTRTENPVLVGETVSVIGRIPEKYIKRGRQYMIYEAWILGKDSCPRMYWRQTRMVAKVD